MGPNGGRSANPVVMADVMAEVPAEPSGEVRVELFSEVLIELLSEVVVEWVVEGLLTVNLRILFAQQPTENRSSIAAAVKRHAAAGRRAIVDS
jgi:hypothetical protein